jgi:hypothetical protein
MLKALDTTASAKYSTKWYSLHAGLVELGFNKTPLRHVIEPNTIISTLLTEMFSCV